MGAADGLEVLEFFEPALEVAAEHLLDDVQAHLEADEALEGAVVEIVGDALALDLAEFFSFSAEETDLEERLIEAVGEDALFERKRGGKDAGEHDERLENLPLEGPNEEEEALAENEYGEDFAPRVEDGGFE